MLGVASWDLFFRNYGIFSDPMALFGRLKIQKWLFYCRHRGEQ